MNKLANKLGYFYKHTYIISFSRAYNETDFGSHNQPSPLFKNFYYDLNKRVCHVISQYFYY